jgi:hypothetical protein
MQCSLNHYGTHSRTTFRSDLETYEALAAAARPGNGDGEGLRVAVLVLIVIEYDL